MILQFVRQLIGAVVNVAVLIAAMFLVALLIISHFWPDYAPAVTTLTDDLHLLSFTLGLIIGAFFS